MREECRGLEKLHKLNFKNVDEIALEAMKRANPEDLRIAEITENIEKVESENRYTVLFDYLSSGIGNDAISPLIKKLRDKNQNLYEDVLSKLTSDYTDTFMDNALLILGGEYKYQDISDKIVETLMSSKIRDPLDFASLLMILGRSKDSRHIDFCILFMFFLKIIFRKRNIMKDHFLD